MYNPSRPMYQRVSLQLHLRVTIVTSTVAINIISTLLMQTLPKTKAVTLLPLLFLMVTCYVNAIANNIIFNACIM